MNAIKTIPQLSENDKRRFFSKVKIEDGGCHLWQAAKLRDGYGVFGLGGKSYRAPRVAFTIAHGEIPEGLWILHECDNPPCCNPAHLFTGTVVDNAADRVAKGRGGCARGESGGRSKLTEESVTAIRDRYAAGGVLHRSLAREFGVSRPLISYIVRRKIWAHIA